MMELSSVHSLVVLTSHLLIISISFANNLVLCQSAPQVSPVNDKMSKRCRSGIAKLNQLHRGGAAVGTV